MGEASLHVRQEELVSQVCRQHSQETPTNPVSLVLATTSQRRHTLQVERWERHQTQHIVWIIADDSRHLKRHLHATACPSDQQTTARGDFVLGKADQASNYQLKASDIGLRHDPYEDRPFFTPARELERQHEILRDHEVQAVKQGFPDNT